MMLDRQLDRSKKFAWQWLAIVSLMALMVVGLSIPGPTTAWSADDEGGAEAAAPEDTSGGEEASTAEASTDEGGSDVTNEGDEASDTPEERSFLSWLISASGWFGAILLFLSFVMVALIMMNMMQIRRDNLLPQDFLDDFEEKLGSRDYQGAYELARSDESLVARVLSAGLGKLNRGYTEAIEAMQEVGEDENMQMEQRVGYLALIGTISPMIGLMGTVYGMIMSFEKIANSATSPKPSELAEGISTALFTTLEGLTVAIPAMIFYSFLRNRIARLLLEIGMASEGLMNRFSTVGKQAKPAAGGGASATAPAAPKQ